MIIITGTGKRVAESYNGDQSGAPLLHVAYNTGLSNQAPDVDAGLNQTITLPENSVVLEGLVTDDGLPNPPGGVDTTWSWMSGPGIVAFDDESAVDAIATFSEAGTYILELMADDGEMDASDVVTIVVNSANTQPITASAGANGSISPQGVIYVNNGTSQQFTITPHANYHVSNVVVDGSSVGAVNSYTFSNVTENHTIYASFEIDTHEITASAGANGNISPRDVVSVDNGSSQSFTITPATGYLVADVVVDGSSVGAATSYSFSNVTADHTIAASFAVDTLIISASAGLNGTISPSGDTPVAYGSDQTFTFTPNEDYRVNEIIVDGASVLTSETFTFSNVIENHTISVIFELDTSDPPISPDEIIIDNGDEGTSFTGRWKVSQCPNPYGETSLYSWSRDGHYAYQAPVNGTYTVLLWWTAHAKLRSNSVPVEIYDGDTLLDTVYVNQQANGGQWNELGNYTFSGAARVVVISKGDRTTGADALRFSR